MYLPTSVKVFTYELLWPQEDAREEKNTDYSMENARVRFVFTSSVVSENERVSFLIQLNEWRKKSYKAFPWCNWFVYFINTEIVEKAILPCPVSTQEIVFPRWNCRKQNWSLAVGVFRFLGASIFNSLLAAIRTLNSRLLFRQKIYEHFHLQLLIVSFYMFSNVRSFAYLFFFNFLNSLISNLTGPLW